MKRITGFCPAETTNKLQGPERGFYSILRYMAAEEAQLPAVSSLHDGDMLILVEINLCHYADSALSERALSGISALFQALRGTGCGLIVRFLYDWEGKNRLTEPKSLASILRHMEQLGPVVQENADIIFLTQGLFVGNWGEMHGSRFLRGEDIKKLYAAYSKAVGERVRLSMRTPALWRSVTGISHLNGIKPTAALPGLFNDGMLGSENDYGTYGEEASARESELAFQEKLCCFVPNGGEVVGTAPQSDAETAMHALSRMHVSYLNRDYDRRTYAKWKSAVIRTECLWNGLTYYDYAEAHLGYRFVVRNVNLRFFGLTGGLTASVAVENVGFAPIYHDVSALLVFIQGNDEVSFPMSGSLAQLVQGMGSAVFETRLSSLEKHLGKGDCVIYFRLVSLKYGVSIQLANQDCTALGCPIGRYFET